MKSSNPQFHSQFGEDEYIFKNLKLPKEGTFVDVGAYDGVESSNTLFFEQYLEWKGFCIEPVRGSWARCVVNRKCACFNVAASNQFGTKWFSYDQRFPGLAKLTNDSKDVLMMETCRIDQLWNGFSPDPPTLLSIDTEGTELEVWQGCGKLRPKIVVVEFLTEPHPPQDKEIVAQFVKDGYKEVYRTHANLIFTL